MDNISRGRWLGGFPPNQTLNPTARTPRVSFTLALQEQYE